MSIQVVNPATGKKIRSYDTLSKEEMWQVVGRSYTTWLEWRKTSFEQRSGYMKRAAQLLRERSAVYGRVITEEMGKTLKSAMAEVEKCARVCDYYADHATKMLSEEHIATDASESFITYNPLGPVLAIMPWNFPFWQVFRFAAPALMAGNTGLLKHASNVPGSALAIEEVFREAGFPEDVFRTLLIKTSWVDELLEHRHVVAATLTGSGPAGSSVASKAGKMLKKTVLTDVTPGMPAFDEELFGPVAALVPAQNEQEAVALANNSIFGLGAAVFTRNMVRGRQIAANELEAGCCFVNDFVKSDPRLPFGGIKTSGYGRELSHLGIREFTNTKTVYVKQP